jgi:hypothetical protein
MLEMLAEFCNRHGGVCRPGIDGTRLRNDSGRQLSSLGGVRILLDCFDHPLPIDAPPISTFF